MTWSPAKVISTVLKAGGGLLLAGCLAVVAIKSVSHKLQTTNSKGAGCAVESIFFTKLI